MGMSAAQAKLLSLTARRSDINFQLSSLMRGKLDLMTQASNAADALNAAKNNNNIFVMTTGDNQQTQLSFNNLAKEGLTIVDSRGRTIVPASYKSNPTGLASILPNNHPAISSYDGDFVVKNKLNKNYISLANTINIFDNDKDNVPSKKIKAASGEPTKKIEFKELTSINGSAFSSCQTTDDVKKILNDSSYNNVIMVVGKNNSSQEKWFDTSGNEQTVNTQYATEFNLGTELTSDNFKNIKKLFASELGLSQVSSLNQELGCDDYTAYNKRQFQYQVGWSSILSEVETHADKTDAEVTYVSNAQQLITALLKGANINNGYIESDANIMLLNDIDLDDMLQGGGKEGLKGFIQDEISSLDFASANETQKTAYNNAMNSFGNLSNSTSKEWDATEWDNLKKNSCEVFYNLAQAYGLSTIPKESGNGFSTLAELNKLNIEDSSYNTNQKELIKQAKQVYEILNYKHTTDKKYYNDKNIGDFTIKKEDWGDLRILNQKINTAAAAAAVGGTKSKKSGIDASVLANIYSKYFSGGTNDKFNEDFTNFIQIDKFKGSIGGGGFAINNLKMDTTNGQFAGMFYEVQDALLDGIWMENAQVLSSGNGTDRNKQNAAILANNVYGKSKINVSAKGQQFTIDKRGDGKSASSFDTKTFLKSARTCDMNYGWSSKKTNRSNQVNAGWSIVQNDRRTNEFILEMYGTNTYTIGSDAGYINSGYSFDSYNSYAGADDKTGHTGWRSVAIDTDRGKGGGRGSNQRLISETGPNNVSDGFSFMDERYEQHLNTICVTHIKQHVQKCAGDNGMNSETGIQRLITNSVYDNSKFKFFTKEEVDSYDEPKGEDWKVGAKFDDGTEVNWDDWYIAPGSFNSETGEYTLTATHGEETAEYVALKENLEFYKSQGVIVEENENRDEGQFTYSARGYSVDLEYKDDLTKYNADNYLYKVENNDSSVIIYEREKVNEVDMSQLVFVDDIEALLDKNIKNGVWFVQGASVSDATKYERKTLDEIGISETTDENADAIAQAEYERKMRDIELQEEKFDAQITELESTLKGIEQEIENQEKIVKQNVQSSFSTFAS